MYVECQFGQQARVIAAARQHVRKNRGHGTPGGRS
jgi:hypothetical protein